MSPLPGAIVRSARTLTLALFAALPALAEEGSTIGTIEAALNGQVKTWYVQDGGDVPGASWIEQEPGLYNAVLSGFESQDGNIEGSQLTVSFEFADGDPKADHGVAGTQDDAASVRLMPSVEDLGVVHTLNDGRVIVDRIIAGNAGAYSFSGTFSGTLTDPEGHVVGELTNGTFQVEQATAVEPR
jgi:hypothetical protein